MNHFINQVWQFFASVKLALFTLASLSVTSIIGTVIPQGESFSFYAKQYGQATARFFHVLDIPEMYTSWWFESLLGLLSINLIVCSIDRFPTAWKMIMADNSQVSIGKLEKMQFKKTVTTASSESSTNLESHLKKTGWSIQKKTNSDQTIIAGQKGRWSRTGVYLVHLSILVIFAGAIIGYFTGFKGSVMIPETKTTTKIFTSKTHAPIDLGFEVRCDHFTIDFYDNGMVKEYTSLLTVLEDGKEIFSKEIEVNSPLKYKGITMYQASYEGYRDFVITLKDPNSNTRKTFIAPFQKQIEWQEKELIFGVVNAEAIRDRVTRMKIWMKSGDNAPATFWVESNVESESSTNKTAYTVLAKQMYATGLQVAKDPGVWTVYFGCFLMMLGLYMAFFMSHRRIWIATGKDAGKDTILIAGSTNKNKLGFEKWFADFSSEAEEIAR